MLNLKKSLLATAVAASAVSMAATAEEKGFMETMADGEASVSFRYRMESVEQDNSLKDAMANTLKTRVNYKTGVYNGLSAFLEFDQVSELADVDYNAVVSGDPAYSVIADPEGTDFNQGYVKYGSDVASAKYGRTRILFDNQRFVGGVGWRQNEQTFDAFVADYKNDNFTVTYAHVMNRLNIFGGINDVKDDMINLQYKFAPYAVLTGYGYFLSDDGVDNSDNDTMGVSFTGKAGLFDYRAEVAQQDTDAYSALYTHLKGSVKTGPVKLGLGYEVLGADGADGAVSFKYGTNHKFNGWADMFLGTPAGGLADLYASVMGKFGPVSGGIIYHDFESDDSDVGVGDLGSEIDFVIKGKAGPVGLMLKYADYSVSDEYHALNEEKNVDTQKIWLQATTQF
ncbi:alginate export family protein [Agaribacterium haliotis]|uniref:alginate export family protein n=1 Tax=Agaribacterium haliotis TaxID=2013869 RepID=UPI0011777F3B|nr:alginate export family protein [Agaribacterium haliotis]